MADTLCLVGAMDSLWFYQIILFPEPISLLCPKILEPPPQLTITNSITPPTSNTSQLSLQHDQDFPLDSSHITTIPLVNCKNKDEELEEESDNLERPTRLSLAKTKARSHSSSPKTQTQRSKGLYYSNSMGALPTRAMARNSKSLWDLEREEVKGFMDLGFTFEKEEISQRMMSLLPGLQRLEEFKNMRKTNQFAIMDAAKAAEKDDDIIYDQEDDEEEKQNRGIMRPYLSESWLIKRPDSPLLNLRIPRASAAHDMKKHLRFWARTVASEIQQES